MYKGLFWITDNNILISFKINCSLDGVPINLETPYNSRKGNSFSHKETWAEATRSFSREIRAKPWNYYRRGRVEIKEAKVLIYHNPTLISPLFENCIRDAFELNNTELTIRFIPDYSSHYKSLIE